MRCRSSYNNIPISRARPLRHPQAFSILYRPRTLAFGHFIDFCYAFSSLFALDSTRGFSAFFLRKEGKTQANLTVGCWMLRNKAWLFLVLACALASSSCTLHRPNGGGGGGGGGGGTATVSFTLVADTLPANPSILSFKVSVSSVVLTPTSGTALTLTPANPVVELMRLQSDTAFLGTLSSVPSGSYTVKVAFSNPEITFFNDTASAITAGSASCASASVCVFSFSASGTPTVGSFTVNVSPSGKQGIGFDFNLNNAISLSSGTLSVNFNPSSPVLSAFTLPRSNANLGANELDLVEDFTGVVSLNGSNSVTLTSLTRGTLTATVASTNFDTDPSGTLCPTGTATLMGCISANQIASMDAILNSDGTFSIREIEPLFSTQQDIVEGIVFSINSPTQFSIAVTDRTQAASNSLIGGLKTGDLLTVNIPSPQPFFVDTKGLLVPAGSKGLFQGLTDTSAIRDGQAVAIHVTAFTAANGTTIASAIASTVTLRWSRLTASLTGAMQPAQINVDAVPSYFFITPSSIFATQVFTGTLGADGVTNLDGVTTAASLNASLPVALRVLYLDNTSHSAPLPFMAAKIRQQ